MKRLSISQIETEFKLADESFTRGSAAAAIRTIDLVLRSNPDCWEAHFRMGHMLMALDRLQDALSSYTQALRYCPNNLEALSLAAQLSLHLRLADRAESFARRLTRLQPNEDSSFFMLSIAFSLTGKWNEALEAIERSLAIQPRNPDYVVGKAQLLVKMHLNALAIEWYRKGLEIRPVPQIAIELAEILMRESFTREAVTLIEEFGSELPVEARPHALLGRAYTESQRFEEAEPHWIAAHKYSNDRLGLIALRAKSEISSGRIDIAEVILRETLAEDPLSPQLFGLLAPITRIANTDRRMVEEMERLLESSEFSPLAGQSLNFALGKSYHDLCDYEKAMNFYDEANRLRAEATPSKFWFERTEWRANIDFQIEYFTKRRIDSLRQEGLENKRPLFIAGMIRSGTTLCEQILSCHSMIKDGGENTFWAVHHSEILDRRVGQFDMAVGKRLGTEYLEILDQHGSDAPYVIDKNPFNVLIGSALACLFPNARMVHLMRHAVDNLLSIWMTPMPTGLQFIATRDDLVFAYQEYLRLVTHMQRVLPDNRFRTFRYEDITSKPSETIEQMLRYLDLDAEPTCFSPEKNRRTVRTPSVFQVRQPINIDSQSRWKLYEPWLGPFGELLGGE